MRVMPVAVISCLFMVASTEMMPPTTLPVERVLKNLEARIRNNPKDAQSEYMLGRVYYTLYCNNDSRAIQVYGTAADPEFPSEHTSPWNFEGRKPSISPGVIKHLSDALQHLNRAVHLGGGTPGLYELTLACAYEAGIPDAEKVERGQPKLAFDRKP
jgi:hypothetical protein